MSYTCHVAASLVFRGLDEIVNCVGSVTIFMINLVNCIR